MARDACKSCGKGIQWATTETGKAIPIDPVPTDDGNIIPILQAHKSTNGVRPTIVAHVLTAAEKAEPPDEEWPFRYTSHFATCPSADQHRKR